MEINPKVVWILDLANESFKNSSYNISQKLKDNMLEELMENIVSIRKQKRNLGRAMEPVIKSQVEILSLKR